MKFQMGKTYYTRGGKRILIIAVDDTQHYECVQGDDKIWRYNRQHPAELGRVTGSPGNNSDDCLLPIESNGEEGYSCRVHMNEMATHIGFLYDVLRMWKCPACVDGKFEKHGVGRKHKRDLREGKTKPRGKHPDHQFVKCKVCNGTGLHPIALNTLLHEDAHRPIEAN